MADEQVAAADEPSAADLKNALEAATKALATFKQDNAMLQAMLEGVSNQRTAYANEAVMLAARLKVAGLA